MVATTFLTLYFSCLNRSDLELKPSQEAGIRALYVYDGSDVFLLDTKFSPTPSSPFLDRSPHQWVCITSAQKSLHTTSSLEAIVYITRS